MNGSPGSLNLFFRLLIAAAVLFVITILALLILPFSSSQSPVSQILNEYGGILIASEVALTLLIGFLAMLIDRRPTPPNPETKTADEPSAPLVDESLDTQP